LWPPAAEDTSRPLAWLGTNPAVIAPVLGTSSTAQIDDAIASLRVGLSDDEIGWRSAVSH
jgi:aryl-alcohol dehydrogenase-like predicted oxidoreductase